jgi:hypothetical protein
MLRRNVLPTTMLTLSIAAMVVFGLIGVGRFGESFADVRYFYFAAKAWFAGENPYNLEVLRAIAKAGDVGEINSFAYPPQSFALGMLLIPFNYANAQTIMCALNIFSAFVLAFWGMKILQWRELSARVQHSNIAQWLIPSIAIANPFTASVLWTTQTSLIVGAALISGWQLVDRGMWILGGALLGFATLKPQLVFFPVLWLILQRRWRVLIVMGTSIIVLAAVPIRVTGLIGTFWDWLQAMKEYQSETANSVGNQYIIGIKSLVSATGLPIPVAVTGFLIFVGTIICLWGLHRSIKNRDDLLSILLSMGTLAIYAHDYDLVILVPLLSCLWWHLRDRPTRQWIALILMTALFIPQRLIDMLGVPLLLHWRTLIVLGLTIWLFVLGKKREVINHSLSISNEPKSSASDRL